MQNRIDTLQTETETQKTIHLTLITSNGVTPGSDTHNIQIMLTMDDLFVMCIKTGANGTSYQQ